MAASAERLVDPPPPADRRRVPLTDLARLLAPLAASLGQPLPTYDRVKRWGYDGRFLTTRVGRGRVADLDEVIAALGLGAQPSQPELPASERRRAAGASISK